jgi:6-phosphofructokinase 2
MAFALAEGNTVSEMARYGVACGAAATMTDGTQLCKKKNVEDLYKWMVSNSARSRKTVLDAL